MSNYIYTEDGGIMLGEDGAPLLSEDTGNAIAEIDFVTPWFTNNPFTVSAVLIPPNAGKAVEITVIYDSPNSISAPAGISFDSSRPSCMCMTVDVEDVNDEYSIYINNVLY